MLLRRDARIVASSRGKKYSTLNGGAINGQWANTILVDCLSYSMSYNYLISSEWPGFCIHLVGMNGICVFQFFILHGTYSVHIWLRASNPTNAQNYFGKKHKVQPSRPTGVILQSMASQTCFSILLSCSYEPSFIIFVFSRGILAFRLRKNTGGDHLTWSTQTHSTCVV